MVAGDHLKHEHPGELVEDSVWVLVGGGGHLFQNFFSTNCNKGCQDSCACKKGFSPFPDTVIGSLPAPSDLLDKH